MSCSSKVNPIIMDIHKRPADSTYLAYGTAGFRASADKLDYVMFRVGLMAALRCCFLSRNIGIMITASHNPEHDNGVKIIEPNGEMLDSEWEDLVEMIVNLEEDKLYEKVESLKDKFKRNPEQYNGMIFIGRDTRNSGPHLLGCLEAGMIAMEHSLKYRDFGITTTPIIHYLVAQSNLLVGGDQIQKEAYYERFISAFRNAFKVYDARINKLKLNYDPTLVVDCANGVGYISMEELIKDSSTIINVSSINTGGGRLNYECGADYIKTKGMSPSCVVSKDIRHASLDGDADRVVYFYVKEEQKIVLVDGDKIACLFALYMKQLLQEASLPIDLSMAIIQTAYANGASTAYIKNELGFRVDCVDTGVKNLHRQAQNYDIAIYFEANGHGTLFLSERARKTVNESNSERLKQVDQMINPYIGDAFTDILLVETILRQFDWNIKKWAEIYDDRPNVLTKLAIKDKNVIQTKDAGTRCVSPPGLQEAIDVIVSKFGNDSRCFVRPSGTENIVRIYAESNTLSDAKRLANLVGEQVKFHTDQ